MNSGIFNLLDSSLDLRNFLITGDVNPKFSTHVAAVVFRIALKMSRICLFHEMAVWVSNYSILESSICYGVKPNVSRKVFKPWYRKIYWECRIFYLKIK